MDKNKISADAVLATSIFLAAQERLNAISAANWALQKLLAAYEGSEVETPRIQSMIDTLIAWQGDRVEKLKPIERENMNEAARLTALLSEN